MRRWTLPALAVLPWGALLVPQAPKPTAAPAPKASYADVSEVMRAHCISCHGRTSPSAGLDLTGPAGIRKGGISGVAVVAGKPDQSLLLQRVLGHGGKPRMPMGFAPLSAAQVQTIRDWIASGASFGAAPKRHWAYIAPVRPAIPVVRQASWVRNPIDAFVLARLERGGLRPSAPASKEVLIRRVTLDLTGLPPTPEEIDAFLADTSPDAYNRVVDRLMASPHFGERQAQVWLDLSRYADSDGYEKDLSRRAWKYRDWLIQAFNSNKPYDQFTIEQIAGDLLPKATQDQLVATGFHRNTQMNLEGGVDQAEAHFKVVLDRADTTATVWLGSTLACAKCHDHKYDPFSQKDYYRMAAFFNNAVIYPRGPKSVSEEKWYEAEIEVPSAAQTERLHQLETERKGYEQALTNWSPPAQREFEDWIAAHRTQSGWNALSDLNAVAQSGVELKRRSDGAWLAAGKPTSQDVYTLTGSANLQGVQALRLEVLTDPSLPSNGPGRAPNGNFVVNRVRIKVNGRELALGPATADFVQREFSAASVVDGSKGWAVDGETGRSHEWVVQLKEPITDSGSVPVEIAIEQTTGYAGHTLGAFRLSVSTAPETVSRFLPDSVAELCRQSNRSAAGEAQLRAYFTGVSSTLAPIRTARDRADQAMAVLKGEIPTALVMRDKPSRSPNTMPLRIRGEFVNPSTIVTAAPPAVFPPMPSAAPGNRLGLARWLVRKDNPLTARVQVNRMWESLWGRGLVETSEDFGTQGKRPSHPELLDWMATEFMRRNWDMKAMLRLMVTSSAYRQASAGTKALRQRDPENILLARGPRFRLDAEAIRDVTLAASGMLDRTVGGPSVYPYQPDGVWDSPYSGEGWHFKPDQSALRRGIYTFWKRTATYPAFTAFDATSRETCTVRRIRTNTPLQALALLNDAARFNAARALAGRMMGRTAVSEPDRLIYGFRLCTGRKPSKAETARLVALFGRMQNRYTADPKAAATVAGDPERAAYTMTANVLLNLDETITKE